MTNDGEKSSDGIWERELVTKLATAALKEQRRARRASMPWPSHTARILRADCGLVDR